MTSWKCVLYANHSCSVLSCLELGIQVSICLQGVLWLCFSHSVPDCCINCFTIWRELFVTRRSRGRGLKRKEFLMSSRSRSSRRVIHFSSRVMRVSGVSMFECERQESVMKIFQNRPPYMSKKKASKKPLICLEGVDKFRPVQTCMCLYLGWVFFFIRHAQETNYCFSSPLLVVRVNTTLSNWSIFRDASAPSVGR